MRRTKAMRLAQESEAACRAINPEAPHLAAESLQEMWKVLNDALPIIEAEADRRTEGEPVTEKGVYWNEMRQLKDEIERVIWKATKKEP